MSDDDRSTTPREDFDGIRKDVQSAKRDFREAREVVGEVAHAVNPFAYLRIRNRVSHIIHRDKKKKK